MDKNLFQMIPRRKAFHSFTGEQRLTPEELSDVTKQLSELRPLCTECL